MCDLGAIVILQQVKIHAPRLDIPEGVIALTGQQKTIFDACPRRSISYVRRSNTNIPSIDDQRL